MWSPSRRWGVVIDEELVYALDADAKVPAEQRLGASAGQTDSLLVDTARKEIVGLALQRARAILDYVARDGERFDFDAANDLLTVAERLLGVAERAASPTFSGDK